MSILNEVFAHKKFEVEMQKKKISFETLVTQAHSMLVPLDFKVAITDGKHRQPRLIAEVKHKSPSKGILREDFDPIELSQTYLNNGAAAISVLTDHKYFGGSLKYLTEIHEKCPSIPLLRKDFIFDEYQLYEARLAGASAALLIVAMLDQARLIELVNIAKKLKITPLVEVHNVEEYKRALGAGAEVLGANNRNLHDFSVDLNITYEIAKIRTDNITLVSESGIKSEADVIQLAEVGVDAILVGETIVVSDDVAGTVRSLSGF